MSTLPIRQAAYVAIHRDFYGKRLTLVAREGDRHPSMVTVDSIFGNLGGDTPIGLKNYIRNHQEEQWVDFGDHVSREFVVSLKVFYTFCQLNPSERLNEFRSTLAAIAESVTVRGSYITSDVSAPADVFLPDDMADDPFAQTMAQMMKLRREQLSQQRELERVGRKVDEIERKADAALSLHRNEVDGFTLMGWSRLHRTEHLNGSKVGIRLSAYCDNNGIATEYTTNPTFGRLRVYP